MKTKAVVFDYGGVICYPPSREDWAALERLTGLPYETLRGLDRQYRGELDRGTYANGTEYYRFLLKNAGVFPEDAQLALIAQTDMNAWTRINPATVQLMRDVKASGITLGILSNLSYDFRAWAKENVPVMGEADTALYSSQYHIIKPEPAIYVKLRELLEMEFEEIVFFDDTVDNITMARKMGIQAFLWENPETARELLAEKGIGVLAS